LAVSCGTTAEFIFTNIAVFCFHPQHPGYYYCKLFINPSKLLYNYTQICSDVQLQVIINNFDEINLPETS